MAVTAADLTAPLGLIEPSLFEGDDLTLEERLDAYIAEAAAKGSPSDEATKAWAYYRAFLAVYIILSGDPESQSYDEQGSAIYHSNQVERFKKLANEQLAIWNTYAVKGVPGTNQGSASLPTTFSW